MLKDPDPGKDCRQEEMGMTEMVGWHHQLNGHGFGWTPEVGDGQGGLSCWDSWGRKDSDTTEQLNWTEPNLIWWIIDFQGTCDPCCYCVLLLRLPVWKHLALLRAESYCMEEPSLARSRKLPKHVWQQGRTLAPGMSLRLEGTLLAACLRGQWPESESLSWLCLGSIWIEALLVTMRFLRTQIGKCRIWSDWNCNGLLPSVVLAFSR